MANVKGPQRRAFLFWLNRYLGQQYKQGVIVTANIEQQAILGRALQRRFHLRTTLHIETIDRDQYIPFAQSGAPARRAWRNTKDQHPLDLAMKR